MATDTNRRISATTFTYYQCRRCNLVFLHPIPENIGDYYPDIYYDIPPTLSALAKRAEIERYKLNLLSSVAPRPGRLLEIGPAYGMFAHLAKTSGWDVCAIEADRRCCQFLRDVLRLEVRQSDDPGKAIFPTDSFQAIALWQVIEHLPDPWSVLAACAQRLEPGGIIIISTPNPTSVQFRFFGRHWTHLDAPRHLWLIPQDLLQKRAEDLGLTLALITVRDRGSRGWNSFGWRVSLQNLVPTRSGKRLMRIVGLLLRFAFAPVEGARHSASSYVAAFRKRDV